MQFLERALFAHRAVRSIVFQSHLPRNAVMRDNRIICNAWRLYVENYVQRF